MVTVDSGCVDVRVGEVSSSTTLFVIFLLLRFREVGGVFMVSVAEIEVVGI